MTAAVVGVILDLTIYLGKAVVFSDSLALAGVDWFSVAWIIISFVAMYRIKLNMIAWIAISALFGLAHYLIGTHFIS